MEAKQAQSHARVMVKALRAFEATEAVLDTAVQAQQRQVAVEERIRVLSQSAKKWEAAFEAAQSAHAKVMAEGKQRYEVATAAHNDIMLVAEQGRELRLSQIDEEVAVALKAGEDKKKALTAECRALEGRRDELRDELEKAREAHAEMLEKLGVKNA